MIPCFINVLLGGTTGGIGRRRRSVDTIRRHSFGGEFGVIIAVHYVFG